MPPVRNKGKNTEERRIKKKIAEQKRAERELAGRSVSRSTQWRHSCGMNSKQKKAIDQQKLSPEEESCLAKAWERRHRAGLLLLSKTLLAAANQLIEIRRPSSEKITGKNWCTDFRKGNKQVLKGVHFSTWKPREIDKYITADTLVDEVMSQLGNEQAEISSENIWQVIITATLLDEFPLDIGNLIEVESKMSIDDCRNTEMITAIECVSKAGKRLRPLFIWPSDSCQESVRIGAGTDWKHISTTKGNFDRASRREWLTNTFNTVTSQREYPGPRILLIDNKIKFGDTRDLCADRDVRLVEANSTEGRSFWESQIAKNSLLQGFREAADAMHVEKARELRREDFNLLYHAAREKIISEYTTIECVPLPAPLPSGSGSESVSVSEDDSMDELGPEPAYVSKSSNPPMTPYQRIVQNKAFENLPNDMKRAISDLQALNEQLLKLRLGT